MPLYEQRTEGEQMSRCRVLFPDEINAMQAVDAKKPRKPCVERMGLVQARAMAQVCLDMHGALGVKWGDDPYSVIRKLKKESRL